MEYKYKVVIRSTRFKKDLKKAERRGLDPQEVEDVIELLRRGDTLPAKYCDHPLSGKYEGCRDCHINPDWLLVYKRLKDELVLIIVRTGTHSDLF